MYVALDVHYFSQSAVVACVGFVDPKAATPSFQKRVICQGEPMPYEPGNFRERELPYLLSILRQIERPSVCIVDSYVMLGPDRKGLGGWLHEETKVPVIGVAKTRFASAAADEVLRGDSKSPLYVTAIGVSGAAELVRSMHGPYRLPTMLKLVDSLARGS